MDERGRKRSMLGPTTMPTCEGWTAEWLTIAEAHPLPYAVAVGLVAGAPAFLIGWIARREWTWFLFIMAAVVPAPPGTSGRAGASRTASALNDTVSTRDSKALPRLLWMLASEASVQLACGAVLARQHRPRYKRIDGRQDSARPQPRVAARL